MAHRIAQSTADINPHHALYTDGGVIGPNPSTIGGTFTCLLIEHGKVREDMAGYVWPANWGTERFPLKGVRQGHEGFNIMGTGQVTNNNSELFAICYGIQNLPYRWNGDVCSDSKLALGWVLANFRRDSLPDILCEYLDNTLIYIEGNRLTLRPVLLAGHPTQAELEQGFKMKPGQNGKEYQYPVSIHNVHCDKRCTAYADHWKAIRADWDKNGMSPIGDIEEGATEASGIKERQEV